MKASELKQTLGKAEQSCRASGARLTEKRRNILAILLRARTPLSAYEIADRYGSDYGEPIPAMSVYRMLDFLAAENLAHKLNSENKYLACGHIACDHRHETPQFLICSRCNKVREIGIKPEVIAALRDTVEGSGYRLLTSQLELDCLCEDCARSAA